MKKALYLLIKSMRRGEKRSFNLFARRYEKENDTGKTRLFDLINSSDTFEEEHLQKQFSKKQDIKHLPVIAHQLFQLILSSIREHSGKHILLLIGLYESNLQYMRFRIETYLIVNNNAMFTALRLKDYSNLFKIINKLRRLSIHFPKLEAFYLQRIFETTYSIELSYYIQEGKINEGLELIPAIESGLKKFPLRGIGVDRYMGISIGVAIICFFHGQLDEAKKWVSKVIELEKEKVGLQIVGYAKILDIMIHYEWENFLFLQNYIPTVRQFLKRHRRLFAIENDLIKLVGKLSQTLAKKEREELMLHYLEELNLQLTSTNSHFLLTHFKINLWVKSLIEYRTLSSLVQDNSHS